MFWEVQGLGGLRSLDAIAVGTSVVSTVADGIIAGVRRAYTGVAHDFIAGEFIIRQVPDIGGDEFVSVIPNRFGLP